MRRIHARDLPRRALQVCDVACTRGGLEPQLQKGVLPLRVKRGCRTGCLVEKEAVDQRGKR